MYRALRLVIEFVAGFVGVAVLLGFLLVWRLNAAPISSTFFTPYLESAIENLVPGARAHIATSVLTWDNADHSVALHAEEVHVTGAEGAAVADVPALDVRISVLGLLLGRLVPASLMIDHPQVKLVRAADGTLFFAGMTTGGTGTSGDIRSTLARIADDATHAFFMRKLEINRAVFDIHDTKDGSDWALGIPEIVLEHSGGDLAGAAKVEVTQKDQTALMDVSYTYDRDEERHNLTARFSDINPSFLAGGYAGTLKAIVDLPLTGEITVGLDQNLNLVAGSVDLHGDAGTLNYPDFWEQPRAIKSLDLAATYDHATRKVDVTKAIVDFGGPKLAATLTGTPPAASATPPRDLDFTLALTLDNVPMDDFVAIWPKSVIPDARDWMTANLTKGKYDHAEATFKGMLSWNDIGNLTLTEGSGKISASGARVTYLEGMPPVDNASADAIFDLNHIVITASGNEGDLKVLPSPIAITDFEGDLQNIELPLRLNGPLPALLHLIDSPPLGYAKAIGLATDDVSGMVDGTLTLRFPLFKALKMSDIDVKAAATLTDVASSKLLTGYDLTQGNWAMDLDKTGFALKGPVAIDKVPVQMSWQEAFAESAGKPLRQASVTGTIDGPQWTQLGIAALGKTKGPIATSLQMLEKNKGMTSFTGTLDMTRAELQVDELNWKKPAGAPAKLTFAAEQPADGNIAVKSLAMEGPQATLKGKATLAAGSLDLVALNLDPFVIGHTDARLRFSQADGADGALTFEVEGKSFDASGLRGGNDPARADPRPKEYHVKIDKLYTSAFGRIDNARGFAIRDKDGWRTISLQGLADGNHPLDIELTAGDGDGRRVFSATCDDFGKALKGLGFTDTVSGGKVVITGASTPDRPNVIEGKAKIGAFEVKDLPALVTLMNATSPFGIFNLIAGTMDFDKLEGKFRWQGDQLELVQVRAAGNSAGMNIDGKVDMDTGAADLHGTMAPFSMFNRVLNYIPILGDMLTGGENQGVLAVNYTIKGTLDKPDVGVNPASLLTPGFLRTLLFGGEDDNSSGGANNTAPQPQPAPPPTVTNFNKGQ